MSDDSTGSDDTTGSDPGSTGNGDTGGDDHTAEIGRIEDAARVRIAAATTLDELRAVESAVVGRRSPLAELRQRLGSLEPDERRNVGRVLNAAM
jgi:hypothetical protein